MKLLKIFISVIVISSIASCGGSDGDSDNDVVPVVSYRMVPNIALFGGADYAGMLLYVEEDCDYSMSPNAALYGGADYAGMLLEVRHNMTANSCLDACRTNPECSFFYYNARGGLSVAPLTTVQDDCAFFRGELWAGAAGNSDTYVKRDPVEAAKQMCTDDPECTFFYYNERGGLNLVPLTTQRYDAAFFRGELWAGAAGNTDTYVKTIDGVDAWDL